MAATEPMPAPTNPDDRSLQDVLHDTQDTLDCLEGYANTLERHLAPVSAPHRPVPTQQVGGAAVDETIHMDTVRAFDRVLGRIATVTAHIEDMTSRLRLRPPHEMAAEEAVSRVREHGGVAWVDARPPDTYVGPSRFA